MILGYPTHDQVKSFSTFELLRAKTLLPPSDTPNERAVMKLVDERLAETNPEHRAIVEGVIGYGPG